MLGMICLMLASYSDGMFAKYWAAHVVAVAAAAAVRARHILTAQFSGSGMWSLFLSGIQTGAYWLTMLLP